MIAGQLRARHHRVLQQPVAASCARRRPPPPCVPSRAARARPRPAPRGSRARRDRGRSARSRAACASISLARPVQLDQQHRARALGVAGADALLDGADDELVDHLERRRDDARGDDRRDRLRGVVDRGEGREQRLHRLGHVEEPHDRPRSPGRACPPTPTIDAGEVVAGPVLRLAAEPHQLPRPGDHLRARARGSP